MKRFNISLPVLACAALSFAADSPGLHPRPAASDYPASESSKSITVGAVVMPSEQVRNTFGTDLQRGYVVVEVGVYPRDGASIDVSSLDFALRAGAAEMVRPARPRAVGSILQERNGALPPRASDVTLYPTAEVGVASGPNGRAVYTGGGVGVGIGDPGQPPRPGPTDRDRAIMAQELEDKALPEGKTERAVAGYLYFPMNTAKRKNVDYELMYYTAGGKLRVLLPPADARH